MKEGHRHGSAGGQDRYAITGRSESGSEAARRPSQGLAPHVWCEPPVVEAYGWVGPAQGAGQGPDPPPRDCLIRHGQRHIAPLLGLFHVPYPKGLTWGGQPPVKSLVNIKASSK